MADARMRDIAEMAGVAISTVSAAINGNGRIAPKTREKILSLAMDLDFHPNAAALALRRKPLVDVGVVVSDHNMFGLIMGDIFHGLTERKLSYQVEQVYYRGNLKPVLPGVMRNKFAAGILHVGYFGDNIRTYASKNSDIPFVAVGEEWDYSVRSDIARGVFNAIEHLVSMGHRDIAMSFGDQHYDFHRQVKRGLEKAVADLNVNIADDWWFMEIAGPSSAENMQICVQWGRSLFQTARCPSAVFCSGIATASAVGYVAMEAGLRLPEQLSIVSIGSPREINLIYPPVSTIEHDYAAVAEAGLKLLGRRLAGQEVQNTKIVLEARFVDRGSVVPMKLKS